MEQPLVHTGPTRRSQRPLQLSLNDILGQILVRVYNLQYQIYSPCIDFRFIKLKPLQEFLSAEYQSYQFLISIFEKRNKVRKRAKIRNIYNQAPHLTQDTNGKVTTSQQDITNESQESSPFPAGDNKASTKRRARKHGKTRQK